MKTFNKIILALSMILILTITQIILGQAQDDSKEAVILQIEGPLVSPILVEYLANGIETANRGEAEIIILELDTPGGSIVIMNQMVESIRGSNVPVVVFVSPRGAIAGSAGTLITLAGHAAAMAPETAIGAASPISSTGEDIEDTLESKIKNALKAQVRSLAEGRPPEAIALAEDTIENATAVSSSEALEIGLIDFIANDLDDLIDQLDGYVVDINEGKRTLDTDNLSITRINSNVLEELLLILTDPNIAFLLLIIGVQAIFIEMRQPGGWVAGFIGVVCLTLAIYAMGILDVNWFGLIFLLIAFVLFIMEAQAPVHGAMALAGTGSLVVSALILFNSPGTPDFLQVSIPLVVVTTLATSAFFLAIIFIVIKAQLAPAQMGQSSLVGQSGKVTATIPAKGRGEVQMGGETWTAQLAEGEDKPIKPGERVEVVDVDGLRIKVKKKG